MDLSTIEKQTKQFADARKELIAIIANLDRNIEALRTAAAKDIRSAAAKVKERRGVLAALIEGARDLFAKPKTQTFHDIKVGLRKGAGGIDWDDDDKVVIHRIEVELPQFAATLIDTKKTIKKDALKGLTVEQLASIGCTVEGTGDVVVVSPVASETEKTVKALLKTYVQEAA